ncbi:MAG TPA: nickel-responsive transcriptional regulator NikR [Actinobacteria bacterium]|nr:nickel-responsive transcriptional regulator NikR [Actinomycetota bacterium]
MAIKRFGVSIDQALVKEFDRLIDQKGYSNRSEAVRDLMRDSLVDEEWQDSESEVVGVVTVVYDHEQRELSHKLTHIQHHFSQAMVSTLHVHLDDHNCLETVVLKGRSGEIKRVAEQLISAKGVKHGKLVATTTGGALV